MILAEDLLRVKRLLKRTKSQPRRYIEETIQNVR
jgi:hypothetical protein